MRKVIMISVVLMAIGAIIGGFFVSTVPSVKKLELTDLKTYDITNPMESYGMVTAEPLSTMAYVDHRGKTITIWLANEKGQWRRKFVLYGDYLQTRVVSINIENVGEPGKGQTQQDYNQVVASCEKQSWFSRSMWW